MYFIYHAHIKMIVIDTKTKLFKAVIFFKRFLRTILNSHENSNAFLQNGSTRNELCIDFIERKLFV
jgi:hypothetical protein